MTVMKPVANTIQLGQGRARYQHQPILVPCNYRRLPLETGCAVAIVLRCHLSLSPNLRQPTTITNSTQKRLG